MKSRGPRSKKSGGHLFPKNVNEPYRAWIRTLPCILLDRACYHRGAPLAHICLGERQGCHVKTRGAGGTDVGNMYSGCSAAHELQHRIGIDAFNRMWGLDLAFLASDYGKIWAERGVSPMRRDYRAFRRGMRVACKVELGVIGTVTRVARDCSWVDVLWRVERSAWVKRMKPHVLVEVGSTPHQEEPRNG